MRNKKAIPFRQLKWLGGLLAIALLLLLVFGGESFFPDWQETFRQTGLEGSAPISEQPLTTHFIDVGQGDSTLLQLPDGRNILIDTGTKGGADAVIRYLQSLDVTTIDYLILTHMHDDHMGGAAKVMKAFSTGKIYLPKVAKKHVPVAKYYTEFLDAAEDQGKTLSRGQADVTVVEGDGLRVELFAPLSEEYANQNNYSIGVKVTYGKNSLLFFGDAEELAEKEVLQSGFDLSADLYHVSHHGSSTSSSEAFLDAVSPRYAVISCGKDNSYGHPDSGVLHAMNSRNIAIFRTDRQGTVVIGCDGSDCTVIQPKEEMRDAA